MRHNFRFGRLDEALVLALMLHATRRVKEVSIHGQEVRATFRAVPL